MAKNKTAIRSVSRYWLLDEYITRVHILVYVVKGYRVISYIPVVNKCFSYYIRGVNQIAILSNRQNTNALNSNTCKLVMKGKG